MFYKYKCILYFIGKLVFTIAANKSINFSKYNSILIIKYKKTSDPSKPVKYI